MKRWAAALVILTSQAQASDWLTHAREGYIEHMVEQHSYRSFCETVAYAGASAALDRDKGIPLEQVITDAHSDHSYSHPLIDESPYVEYAITAAYQSSRSAEEVRMLLSVGCGGGHDLFAVPFEAYQRGLTAPDPSEQEVREFACQRGYGPKAYLLHKVMYEVGLGISQILERSITTSPITTRHLQREIVHYLERERPVSADAAEERITNDCLSGSGLFQ